MLLPSQLVEPLLLKDAQHFFMIKKDISFAGMARSAPPLPLDTSQGWNGMRSCDLPAFPQLSFVRGPVQALELSKRKVLLESIQTVFMPTASRLTLL